MLIIHCNYCLFVHFIATYFPCCHYMDLMAIETTDSIITQNIDGMALNTLISLDINVYELLIML